MYKRKLPKAKTIVEKPQSPLPKSSKNFLDIGSSTLSNTSNPNDDESSVSPPLLDDFEGFPVEKKKKTVDSFVEDAATDSGSEPLFDDNDNSHSFLKQTLLNCGLTLKCDQNILCKYILRSTNLDFRL